MSVRSSMILLRRFHRNYIDYPIILHCQRNGNMYCATGGVLRYELCHLNKITELGGYTDIAFANCRRCILDHPKCTVDCSHQMLLSTVDHMLTTVVSKSENGNGNYF